MNLARARDDASLTLLSQLVVAPPMPICNIAIVPLLEEPDGPGFDILGNWNASPDLDLLEDGHTTVTEVSEAGDVSRVLVRHDGKRHLLLLNGEYLLGAKQNRVFESSFVIPPKQTLQVPVSCVEKGRWSAVSSTLAQSGDTVISRLRCRRLHRVESSLFNGLGYDAGQFATWREVDEFLAQSGIRSCTHSYADAVTPRCLALTEALTRFPAQREQVGVAVVVGEEVATIDVLGSAELFARVWPKLGRGILGDVGGPPLSADPAGCVKTTLAAAARIRCDRTPSPGAGDTWHGHGYGLSLVGVIHERQLVHVAVAGFG